MAIISLEQKAVVLTGAARGIGAAIARLLAAEKSELLITGRDLKKLQLQKEIIEKLGGAAHIIAGDMTEDETPKQIVAKAEQVFGRIDILINNAGTASNTSFEDTGNEDWDRIMNLNARAPFILCRDSLPLLRKSSDPMICNISSVVGKKGYDGQAAYSASKHALMGFSKALAREVRAEGIKVVTVSPGAVATGLIKKVRPDLDESILISPDEVAEGVLFLLKFRGNGTVDDLAIRRTQGTPFD